MTRPNYHHNYANDAPWVLLDIDDNNNINSKTNWHVRKLSEAPTQ